MEIKDLKIDNIPTTYIDWFVKQILKAVQSSQANVEKLLDNEYLFNCENSYLLVEDRDKNLFAICTFNVVDIDTKPEKDINKPFTEMLREKIRISDLAKNNPEKYESLQKAAFAEVQFFRPGKEVEKIVSDTCNIDDEFFKAAELMRHYSKNVGDYCDSMKAMDLIDSPEVLKIIKQLNGMPCRVRQSIIQRLR